MLVPAAIMLICFGAGAVAAGRWLPDLALGPVGGMAFFAVCGLVGVALALVGLHIYEIAKLLEGSLGGRDSESVLVTGSLENMLSDAGPVFGLAAVVYLLAPSPEDELTDDPSLVGSTQTP
jgi:hypothetical protein